MKTAIIAGRLGLADGTVETHIKHARAKLGGVSRFDAADSLRAFEAARPPPAPTLDSQSLDSQALASQTLGMADRRSPQPYAIAVGQLADREEAKEELHEQRASFAYTAGDVVLRQPSGRGRHDLGTIGRIGMVMAMTVGFALVLVAVLTMFGTIDRTLPGRLITYRTR